MQLMPAPFRAQFGHKLRREDQLLASRPPQLSLT
ncbi:hypothetical protein M758_1G121600 [Ceratodon purpureus]|nr:hypothetical protein M758_1G121600 [Ceratodon purpureus]